MSDSSSIAVFDSGVGGLTVVRRIIERLPSETILFVADQAHVPYGGRPLAEVAGFALGITEAAVEAGAKAVVMACNISSATALDSAREHHANRAITGVIAPGARSAVAATRTGSICVLATAGTVASGAYSRTLLALKGDLKVIEVACPDFVPLIEAGHTESAATHRVAEEYMEPVLRTCADTVILGCTHYPFLLPCLQSIAPDLAFIDPAVHTVCELEAELDMRTARVAYGAQPNYSFYTTGDLTTFTGQLNMFLPDALSYGAVRQAYWIDGRLQLDPQ